MESLIDFAISLSKRSDLASEVFAELVEK